MSRFHFKISWAILWFSIAATILSISSPYPRPILSLSSPYPRPSSLYYPFPIPILSLSSLCPPKIDPKVVPYMVPYKGPKSIPKWSLIWSPIRDRNRSQIGPLYGIVLKAPLRTKNVDFASEVSTFLGVAAGGWTPVGTTPRDHPTGPPRGTPPRDHPPGGPWGKLKGGFENDTTSDFHLRQRLLVSHGGTIQRSLARPLRKNDVHKTYVKKQEDSWPIRLRQKNSKQKQTSETSKQDVN